MNQHEVNSNLNDAEVISLLRSSDYSEKPETFKVSTLLQILSKLFENRYMEEVIEETFSGQHFNFPPSYQLKIDDETRIISQKWWQDGLECEVLRLGNESWKRGKVRLKATITLEFVPEEQAQASDNQVEDSPLDKFRQSY
ncbi:MAG: KGK domain-containing protein [Leptolyngbyaceae bacterium]|nr:KGK domain-containing protein [Leptolyngbyaceae bacterium]